MDTNAVRPKTDGQPTPLRSQLPSELDIGPVRQDEPWLRSLLRPLLIALLVGSVVVALVGFMEHAAPLRPGFTTLVLLTATGAALIGGYTTTLLVRPAHRHQRGLGFRLAELGVLLAGLRLLLWLLVEGFPSVERMLYTPLETLISGYFVAGAVVLVLSWSIAVLVTNDFLDMALRPDELIEPRDHGDRRWAPDVRVQSDRQGILNRFVGRWIAGGILILIATAGSQVGPSSNGFFAITRQAIDPAVMAAGIIYFLVGLILIAMGRLAVLRAQWQIERIQIEESILRNWPAYAIALLVVIGLTALVLPLGGTFRLAQILGVLIRIVYLASYFFLGLLMSILGLLLGRDDTPLETPETAQPIMPPPVEETGPAFTLPPWVGGSLFWIIVTLLIGYASYVYLQDRGVNFAWLRLLWERLRRRWGRMRDALESWRASMEASGAEEDETKPRRRGLRWFERIRLGRLSPEQRIRYYYLTTLERAQEEGIPRRPGETPLRYAPRLEQSITEDPEHPVLQLTDEFVQLHYANRPVDTEEASYFHRVWQRIQEALQRRHRQSPPQDEPAASAASAPDASDSLT